MIMTSYTPVLAVSCGLFAAILILFLGNKINPNTRESITIITSIIMTTLVFIMVPEVLNGNVYEATLWQIVDGIELKFKTDAAGMIFACIASFLWILTSIYSIGYVRGHHEKNQTGYFAAFATCIASAIGIAFSANLITFFIFYEMLTASFPIIMSFSAKLLWLELPVLC